MTEYSQIQLLLLAVLLLGCIQSPQNSENMPETKILPPTENTTSKVSSGSPEVSPQLPPVSPQEVPLTNITSLPPEENLPNTSKKSPDWSPQIGSTFQWQLTDPVDASIDSDIYDIDLFDNDKELIETLHKNGSRIICYLSVGSWEDWRPDKDDFPYSVIGRDYDGWEGEKWLDIRRIDLLGPIMIKRLDLAKEKGCDAIEPDNIDGYDADTGFPLTYTDQLRYNIWLANETHKRGMSIGLKNDVAQAADLLEYFDWAITEDCYAEGWCDDMKPFVLVGKAVFQVEYTDAGTTLNDFCTQAKGNNFTAILKNRELDAWLEKCN